MFILNVKTLHIVVSFLHLNQMTYLIIHLSNLTLTQRSHTYTLWIYTELF